MSEHQSMSGVADTLGVLSSVGLAWGRCATYMTWLAGATVLRLRGGGMDDTDRAYTEQLIDTLSGCARYLGRKLADIDDRHLGARLAEGDAELFEQGLRQGLLQIEGNYLHTLDPHQATAWLVEGTPARPCWEYVPHAAVYVELISLRGYPVGAVRFETPEREADMSLDL